MENSTTVFPTEIIEEILSRLPVKTLKKLECVSKTWNTLITSSRFIDFHLSRSKENIRNFHIMVRVVSQDDERLGVVDFNGEHLPHVSGCNAELWGSSNGLLFAMHHHHTREDYMFLLNPSTNEYKKLPPPIDPEHHHRSYGFGYNPKTMDYEVVVILLGDGDCHVVQVYSLRNNSWRRLEDISYFIDTEIIGEFVKGKLYWPLQSCIVSYDMANEKFQEVSRPIIVPGQWHVLYTNIKALGENYLYYFGNFDGTLIKAWVMKDDGGRISWTKMIEVKCKSLDVLFSTKEGSALILRDDKYFVGYDARNGTWKNQAIKDELKGLLGFGCTFSPSLVALGAGSEKMGNTLALSKHAQSDLSKLQALATKFLY